MNPDEGVAEVKEEEKNWQPILELAAKEVFEIMLATALEPAPADQPKPPGEFTAMIGLAGELCGVMTMQCSAQAAALMASKMLGISLEQADPQMWDAGGEICNMVAGNFKNKVTGPASRCLLSPPTVITGGDYSFRSLSGGESYEVMLVFGGVPLLISLELHG